MFPCFTVLLPIPKFGILRLKCCGSASCRVSKQEFQSQCSIYMFSAKATKSKLKCTMQHHWALPVVDSEYCTTLKYVQAFCWVFTTLFKLELSNFHQFIVCLQIKYPQFVLFFLSEHNCTPKWKENSDWSAGNNYIPSAKYLGVGGRPFRSVDNKALSRFTIVNLLNARW